MRFKATLSQTQVQTLNTTLSLISRHSSTSILKISSSVLRFSSIPQTASTSSSNNSNNTSANSTYANTSENENQIKSYMTLPTSLIFSSVLLNSVENNQIIVQLDITHLTLALQSIALKMHSTTASAGVDSGEGRLVAFCSMKLIKRRYGDKSTGNESSIPVLCVSGGIGAISVSHDLPIKLLTLKMYPPYLPPGLHGKRVMRGAGRRRKNDSDDDDDDDDDDSDDNNNEVEGPQPAMEILLPPFTIDKGSKRDAGGFFQKNTNTGSGGGIQQVKTVVDKLKVLSGGWIYVEGVVHASENGDDGRRRETNSNKRKMKDGKLKFEVEGDSALIKVEFTNGVKVRQSNIPLAPKSNAANSSDGDDGDALPDVNKENEETRIKINSKSLAKLLSFGVSHNRYLIQQSILQLYKHEMVILHLVLNDLWGADGGRGEEGGRVMLYCPVGIDDEEG